MDPDPDKHKETNRLWLVELEPTTNCYALACEWYANDSHRGKKKLMMGIVDREHCDSGIIKPFNRNKME